MYSEDKKIRVLYIDDEINNLLSFQAAFRRKYKIFIASSGAEGMNILNDEKDIQVIVCDQRMPQSTGVELMLLIKEKYSATLRNRGMNLNCRMPFRMLMNYMLRASS